MSFLRRWLTYLRWWVRGVSVGSLRTLCVRCKQTGHEHWGWNGCLRFVESKQSTHCWCPGCRIDLCTQDDALIDASCGPEDLVWYRCTRCGQHSVWNFDHIAPFVVSKEPWITDNVEWLPFNSRSRR